MAGYAVGTVSRVLNNNPRAASRDQILALLEANFEA